ncbi:MAG: histidine phosphatase family protein [Bacteroidetes bacterium]|nr:histidine phosphatase family protein [Bacteroidota bacterium]
MKTTYYIVRHGETEGNIKLIIQGHSDSPLTEKGLEQAQLISEQLSEIPFHTAYSSDLGRAKQTAEIIIKDREIKLNTTTHLRERCFGTYEMRSYDDLYKHYIEGYELLKKLPHEERRSYKISDDIENDEELWKRFSTFISETSGMNEGKTLLALSHGGYMKALLLELGYGEYEKVLTGRFDNTGYIKLIVEGNQMNVEEVKGFISS